MALNFNLASREFAENPYPILAQLREAGPVVRHKMPIIGTVVLLTSYEAVDYVLRDHKRFVREASNAGKNKWLDLQWWLSKAFRSVAENMLAKDEPDHRRLRALVDDAFQRRSVEEMTPRLHEIAEETLDEVLADPLEDGCIDFLVFARQFPLAVICELMGLPKEHRHDFTRWVRGLTTLKSVWDIMKIVPSIVKINRYFRRQIRECRREPREGLLSLLVETRHSGDSLSDRELLAMAFLLLFAGHETTTHLITDGMLSLLDHPSQKDELMSDWSLAESAVDEMLRYNSPIQFTKPRLPSENMELFGEPIKRGEYLIPMLSAANVDPAVFDNPEQFDIHRNPNPHLGFGTGIHVCLGLKLARLEAAIAFEHLFTRFPNLELGIPRDQLDWITRIGIRGLHSLPLRLGEEAKQNQLHAIAECQP